MQPFFQYYNRVQTVHGSFGKLPIWARYIVLLFALPGIAIAILSLAGFVISILALLLLTAPVYRALQVVTGNSGPGNRFMEIPSESVSPGAKPVEARVVE